MATFTLEQVQKHNTVDDLWIVLHNKGSLPPPGLRPRLTSTVYDVTKYLDDHPGGTEVLVEVAGTDATEAFEGVGHSDEAREQLEPYYVGDLPSEVPYAPSTCNSPSDIFRNKPKPSRSTARISSKSRSRLPST
jgi:cytochrome-b5 reductase